MFKDEVKGGSLNWLLKKKITFIGDSITAEKRSNYVTLTLDKLADQIDVNSIEVFNHAVDSCSIHDALDMTPEIISEENPDVFIIFVGINDSKILRYIDRPLISPSVFKEGFGALLNRIDADGGIRTKVILTLPALLFEEIESGECLAEYWYWKPELYLEYNEIIREFGNRKGCAVAEVCESFNRALSSGPRLFYEDGVHPNIYGHRLIAQEVVRALLKLGGQGRVL